MNLLSTGFILAAAAGLPFCSAINLNPGDSASVKNAARTIAYGLQSYYANNQSTTPATAVGTFPGPTWYWWKGAAVWGGMIDYWAYTGDSSWNSVIQQGILAQVGPEYNFEPPAYNGNLGNDDQAIWAMAALSALEYGFPAPEGHGNGSFWLDLAVNVFNRQISRWDTSTCGGGIQWQVFDSNPGWGYKNSISNGALFQIASRLAHYTGNQTYIEWANKTWDWMSAIGLIGPLFAVFDGSNSNINCSDINHVQWTYNPAMLIYGTAMLANYTNTQLWKNRTDGLLTAIEGNFFNAFPSNASNVMVETACEPFHTCDTDQYAFKAFLSRFLGKAAAVYPSIEPNVNKFMVATANAVAKACSGGDSGTACGTKWYTGSYDGNTGFDQELTALETIQSLLLLSSTGGAATHRVPFTSNKVQIKVIPVTSTYPLIPPTEPPSPKASSNGVSSLCSSLHLTRSAISGLGMAANRPGRAAIATFSAGAFRCYIILIVVIEWFKG